jgi:hypothetical protein
MLEQIEAVSKSFYDKYAGKGLSPSEVMELHKSEYWELIEQEIREKTLKEAGLIMEGLFHKGVSSFKYKADSEGCYYLTFPHDDFTIVMNNFKLGQSPKEV